MSPALAPARTGADDPAWRLRLVEQQWRNLERGTASHDRGELLARFERAARAFLTGG